jgi:hypothetical protein
VDVRDRTQAERRPQRRGGGGGGHGGFGDRAPDKERLAGAIKAAYAEAP